MNARKHRYTQQDKETDRLGPKGRQSGSGAPESPDANQRTAGVQSEPKSSWEHCRTRERCQPRPAPRPGRPHRKAGQGAQPWEDRKSQGQRVMRRISPRRSGLNWQENRRNRYQPGKQMTTDARRLMRPGAVAQRSTASCGHTPVLPSGLTNRGPVALASDRSYEGLSRMKGNFQVRFLGGRGRATARAYPAWLRGSLGVALSPFEVRGSRFKVRGSGFGSRPEIGWYF